MAFSEAEAMKHIFFFATPSDISPVLERFEAHAPLKFVAAGKQATPERPIFLKSAEIPQPGIATCETGASSTTYLVSHRETKNRVYIFHGDDGRQRWLLSNGDNEETVSLTLAGLWITGPLLPGNISTLHQTSTAQELMRWFQSALNQEGFKRVEAWWLGHEALELLKDGKRLATTAEQSPAEFDLKWS